ncbi:MAG: hypothetical protein KDH20_14215 [Rhodocyclaceae bacterium]|nr:hypothetical protein [Rhodocyclaceae bacterium]
MTAVEAEFERGSEWDAQVLLFSALSIVGAFLSTMDMWPWPATDAGLVPLLTLGVSLLAAHIVHRAVRPRLRVTLLAVRDGRLVIRPVRLLPFSGWVDRAPLEVRPAEIREIRAHALYNAGSGTGMDCVSIELNDRRTVEYHLNDNALRDRILAFLARHAADVPREIDPRLSP